MGLTGNGQGIGISLDSTAGRVMAVGVDVGDICRCSFIPVCQIFDSLPLCLRREKSS
jgi:hypothetical protein